VPKQPKEESVLVLASKKIEHAERDKIEDLDLYVQKVLEALGHPEAFVTDESMIWDFVPHLGSSSPETQVFLDALGEKLGFKVDHQDYIWDLAKKLMD